MHDFLQLDKEFVNSYKDKKVPWGFNGLGYVVYKRTYAREIPELGRTEEWHETIERCINGAQKIGAGYTKEEAEKLFDYMFNLKCNMAGRMLWQLGTGTVDKLGLPSLANCWFTTIQKPEDFCFLFNHLMLGGGVGFSVKKEHIHELPKIKNNVNITHERTKDADFIVPDSREGWVELLRKVLNSYFVTGQSFSYSTILIREAGELIKTFGGKASGYKILVDGISDISKILSSRQGKKLRSVDVLDICNIIGSIVVSGNVRRSAEIAIGDPDDYLYVRAKNWSTGNIPNWRGMSNNSIEADSFEQISNDIWNGYDGNGEPYGFINLKLARTYGRLGEKVKDEVEGMNPCVTGDTLILTDDGYKRIDSVIEKQVNVWNGFEWSEVTPKVTGYNQPLLKIKFSDGRELTCTEYHNFVLSTNYYGGEKKVKAIELKVGDKLIKHNFPVIESGKIIDEKQAYTQGFISADGMDGYNYFWIYGDKDVCIPRLSGKIFRTPQISKTGIVRQSFNFDFEAMPKDFVPFDWDLKSKLNWLAGLFDGDGTVVNDSSIQLASVNKQFLLDIQSLLSTIGVDSKVLFGRAEGVRKIPDNKGEGELKDYFCQELWRITINSKQVEHMLELGFKCERLKFEKETNRDCTNFTKVISIENYGYADEVYCFTEPKRNLGCFNGIVTGQCAEATLQDKEPCDLAELYLNNISSLEEMKECAYLLYKTQKAILMLPSIYEETTKIVRKNMRVGLGITGICQSQDKLDWCDPTYKFLREFDILWSKERGWNKSIKLTVIKPSGTLSLLAGSTPGVHPAFSKFYIRRVRMASNDPLVSLCREAGYVVEYQKNFDGTENRDTVVVEFPCFTGDNAILTSEMSAIKQLELVKKMQTIWADQAVSVTVYYRKEELPEIKEWLKHNYEKSLKSVSFLLHSGHGFMQAPYEEITEEKYNLLSSKIKSITINKEFQEIFEGLDCEGGACPVR